MLYQLTFGKYKGSCFGEVMRTPEGRRYLQWLADSKNEDPQWEQATEKRKQRIAACFEVYQKYLATVETHENKNL
jgi:hypothetical protein